MKRLFLLIAVCMIGMVNALAGFTVVPNEPGAGSYVLTFKETAGEGETLYDWSDIWYKNPMTQERTPGPLLPFISYIRHG